MSRTIPAEAQPRSDGTTRRLYDRVVLLGFMASGKTVVGRILARRLGWKHIDLDKQIEKHTGTLIPEIFARSGEAGFRALETELTPRFTAVRGVVLSPGGGWIKNPGVLENLPPRTLTVWLRVSPEEVTRRLAASRRGSIRPLLHGAEDPRAHVQALLAEREPLYRRAAVVIETDGRSLDSIVAELAEIVEGGGQRSLPDGLS